MIKKKIFSRIGVGLGILALSGGLYFGSATTAFSSSIYTEKEYAVQKQVINTFDLDTSNLKPLFIDDIYNDKIATESSEVRGKIANAIDILHRNGEFGVGDFEPMAFLKGNNTVLIGIKHANNTITLAKFDLSNQKPVKIDKQDKEVKE